MFYNIKKQVKADQHNRQTFSQPPEVPIIRVL